MTIIRPQFLGPEVSERAWRASLRIGRTVRTLSSTPTRRTHNPLQVTNPAILAGVGSLRDDLFDAVFGGLDGLRDRVICSITRDTTS